MRHILTEIIPKFKLRIRYVLKRFVKRKISLYIEFVRLFELMPYIPVNSNGHVESLPSFYGTFIKH